MSQNGPYPGQPWPGGSSDDEPYAEPADPWGEHAVSEPSWGANPPPIPHQPPISHQSASFHSAAPDDSGVAAVCGKEAGADCSARCSSSRNCTPESARISNGPWP